MSRSAPGPLLRFARAGWNAVNFTRRLVFNAIFLFIGLIVLVALFSGRPKLPERSALVIAPQGQVVEQFSADPFERALSKAINQPLPETQLRDLVRALEAAATDSRIERVVIRPDQMTGIGFAALEELARAVTEFRKSGKQLVAYADGMDQKQYYLAALADEVYLHPDGMVLLEGLSRYRAYYREALEDKLGVDVHLFRVGEYKSAAEPYILDAASPESREADLYWMNDLWRHFLADVARLRSLDADALQAGIDDFAARVESVAGDMGKLALEQKLVDGLVTQDQFRDLMVERGVEDTETHSFRQVSMDAYLGFVDRERPAFDARPKVAIVVAQGEIAAGDLPPGTVGGVSTSRLLRDAREDADVKAVVLRVDSPGGGVFPSEQIRREVELIRAVGKPVVVSMGNVAASGGYWISMNADAIYAQPTTITGSIGIFGLFMTIPDTLAKIGVHVDGVATTKIAGAFDPTRPMSVEVGKTIQAIIDQGYRQFIGKVAAARETTPEAIDQVARGRVWSGTQAEARGLVDELGGLHDAVAEAARRATLPSDGYRVQYVEKTLSPFEQALVNAGRNATVRALMAQAGLPTLLLDAPGTRELGKTLRLLDSPPEGGRPFKAVAHCFCEP
ncbi:MAG: signal peptide peptidase SppA [Chiayiivirga sp.]|jgi:protease-4|uniref:Signal peptide peptidase SppA n=1 Tax=Denitratimonas tolerans TaxID=1338420 RepID=A0AAW9R7B8_9GAMM|nr:signal peptide peptidase SppA [Chiayiivirga sp.]